jgi:hypothetical protein
MVYDLQLAIGDICEDPTGLLVRVEDIDVYDYVHFSVIESSTRGFDETESGEMSHVAFAYRFTKLGNMLLKQDSRLTGTCDNDGPAHSFGEPVTVYKRRYC